MKLIRPNLDQGFSNLLRQRAATDPDKQWASEVTGNRISNREGWERGLRVAGGLGRLGVRKGDRVVSLMDPSVDAVVLLTACALIGAIYVPLNVAYRGYMLEHALNTVKGAVIVVDEAYLANLEEIRRDSAVPVVVRGSERIDVGVDLERTAPGFDELLSGMAISETQVVTGAWEDTALFLLTSGTTGASKAVVISWLHFYTSCLRILQIRELGCDDNIYSPWPINHISGAIVPYASLLIGCAFTLRSRWSTTNLLGDLSLNHCTSMILMGETVKYFVKLNGVNKTKLKKIFIAPVYDEIVECLAANGIKYCTNYNSTETNSPIGSDGYEPVPLWSCGRARDDVELKLVGEDGKEVRTGEVGELLVRTLDPYRMARGYWNMEEKTRKSWQDGWFHTGDFLRKDDSGYYYFIARGGDRIRVKGENVSADELEFVISGCEGVKECCAVADSRQGQEDKIWVFATTYGSLKTDDVMNYCERKLPKFMIPGVLRIVEELPLTPTGKVQRAIVRRQVLNGEWD